MHVQSLNGIAKVYEELGDTLDSKKYKKNGKRNFGQNFGWKSRRLNTQTL